LESALAVPVIGMESPRGVNDPGLGAFAEILAEADLVVLLGKPLDFTLRFGAALSPDCRLIVLDPDAAQIARATAVTGARAVVTAGVDSRTAIEALTAEPAPPDRAAWSGQVREALGFKMPAWATVRATAGRVHPVELCRAVDAFLARYPGATLVCDGGEIGQWPQALVDSERRLINGVAGTIGVSLPFAIAAQALRPDKPVVAIMGDGTFGFHMAELDTALRYRLPVIAIVGNDARWNAEYQIQLRQYGAERARNCDLLPSRYERVAEGLGGFGALATSEAELSDALERAQASGLPACINVMLEGAPAPVIRRR
jgi:acetolactate synthase-1/2/3 large subunit